VCDLETSRMGAPYIYDISHLRVKGSWLFYLSNNFTKKIGNFLHPRKCLEDASLIPAGTEF